MVARIERTGDRVRVSAPRRVDSQLTESFDLAWADSEHPRRAGHLGPHLARRPAVRRRHHADPSPVGARGCRVRGGRPRRARCSSEPATRSTARWARPGTDAEPRSTPSTPADRAAPSGRPRCRVTGASCTGCDGAAGARTVVPRPQRRGHERLDSRVRQPAGARWTSELVRRPCAGCRGPGGPLCRAVLGGLRRRGAHGAPCGHGRTGSRRCRPPRTTPDPCARRWSRSRTTAGGRCGAPLAAALGVAPSPTRCSTSTRATAVRLVPVPGSPGSAHARDGDHVVELAGRAAAPASGAGLQRHGRHRVLVPARRRRDQVGLGREARAANLSGSVVARRWTGRAPVPDATGSGRTGALPSCSSTTSSPPVPPSRSARGRCGRRRGTGRRSGRGGRGASLLMLPCAVSRAPVV